MNETFLFIELISIFTLIYSAYNENNLIYNTINKKIPYSQKENNANFIENSIKCLFKDKGNEIIVFNYSIVFLAIILNIYLYLNMKSLLTETLKIYLIVSFIIILMHILIPYYFSYIKFFENSINKNLNLKDYLKYGFKIFKYNKKNIINKKNKGFFNEYKIDNYNLYVNDMNNYGFIPLSINEYKQYISYFDKYNVFIKEDNEIIRLLIIDNENIEKNTFSEEFNSLYFGIHKEIDFNLILLTRIVESILFFMVLNYILIGGK
jgi:hypothetical protein